ncbi:MAG: hypothetical protein K6F63_06875 [Lachnospiraceae bacterium]|nr:hypothetical protein [Lachnospiraceae bacterium]
MSLVIVMMIIAVFSVLIIGTYTVLDRHVSNTVDSEANNGAYYTGEGVLRITSTEIDQLAFKISNDANAREEVLTKDEFVTRLNASIASQVEGYFVSKIDSGSFNEYNIESITVVPSTMTSDEYTCLYDITTIISNDRNTRKKITGIYGVLYLTESSQSTTTTTMIINENTPMLTALEDITSERQVSLNGNAKLKGSFTYPDHYSAETDPEHFENNGNTFEVDTSTLVRGNVKIPEIPDPPNEGSHANLFRYETPSGINGKYSTKDINTISLPRVNNQGQTQYDFYMWDEFQVNSKLTINIASNADDCYTNFGSLILKDEVELNVHSDGYQFQVGSNFAAGRRGKLTVNTNGHDVYILCNNLTPDYDTETLTVKTTGSGTVYIYFYNNIQQQNKDNIDVDITNEGDINIIIINNLIINNGYRKITFNAFPPIGSDHGGTINFFVIDRADSDNNHRFGIWQNGSMAFNAPAGTNINVIADNLYMYGDLEINGEAPVNLYARKRCQFNGDPWNNNHYPVLKTLSNFSFTDDSLNENEKAKKIIDTGLNIYYYGTEDLIIKNYKCCANFYSAGAADIDIANCLFYGNIFSSAPSPQNGRSRYNLKFQNSYLSCGAIYAPRMNIDVEGVTTVYKDEPNPYPHSYITDEGSFVTCIFACVTGYNIDFSGNSMAKSSNVATEHMELHVEMDFMPGVVAIGDNYSGSHFFRGFKVE